MTSSKDRRYSYRIEAGGEFIELHVSKEPVDLTWEWRMYTRFNDSRLPKFKTFEEAKRDGLFAVRSLAAMFRDKWASALDQLEKEILG